LDAAAEMTISNLVRITVDDMLLEWALAEMFEWRRLSAELDVIAQAVTGVTDAGARLSMADREATIRAFARIERRGAEVAFFRAQLAEWYEAEFAIAALGEVRLHRHWGLNHWLPISDAAKPYPGTVAEFAGRADKPKDFDRADGPHRLNGRRPILVATDLSGPWHRAEGSHRADSVWIAHSRGIPAYQGSLRVTIGVHPNMDRWPSFLR
jgi:hypothetical protein